MHETVKKLYSWRDVAERTEKVYYDVMLQPRNSILTSVKYKLSLGPFSGILALSSAMIMYIVLFLLDLFYPRESIDIAEEFDVRAYKENAAKYGDHMFDVKQDLGDKSCQNVKGSLNEYFRKRTSMNEVMRASKREQNE